MHVIGEVGIVVSHFESVKLEEGVSNHLIGTRPVPGWGNGEQRSHIPVTVNHAVKSLELRSASQLRPEDRQLQ